MLGTVLMPAKRVVSGAAELAPQVARALPGLLVCCHPRGHKLLEALYALTSTLTGVRIGWTE
jgi:hypothetical protein